MGNERLDEFTLHGGWREDDEDGITESERGSLGWDLAGQYNASAQTLGYLQRLIAGPDNPLPYAPPCVRIVISRDGWKTKYALIYGFPLAESTKDSAHPQYSESATRYPEEAVMFKVFYGADYGEGGYEKVEIAQPLEPELESRLERGDFTDDEAEQLLGIMDGFRTTYDELLIAARDPELNPEYAVRVNEMFYENAAAAGL